MTLHVCEFVGLWVYGFVGRLVYRLVGVRVYGKVGLQVRVVCGSAGLWVYGSKGLWVYRSVGSADLLVYALSIEVLYHQLNSETCVLSLKARMLGLVKNDAHIYNYAHSEYPSPNASAGRKRRPEGAPRDHI